MVVWTRNENKIEKGVLGEYEAASQHMELKSEAVTALAFAPEFVLESYFVAVGLEVGVIQCFMWMPKGWERVFYLDRKCVVACFTFYTIKVVLLQLGASFDGEKVSV